MPKPKLMLDTNVASKLSADTGEFDSARIKHRIAEQFRIVVSPLTLIELMGGVILGRTEAHLQADQRRLRVLIGQGNPDILRFPARFALYTVLGIDRNVQGFNPADFRLWVKTIRYAKNRFELANGFVKIPNQGGTFGLDESAIANQESEAKRRHQSWLQAVKSGTTAFLPRTEWANRIGAWLEEDLDASQGLLLGERLSAAYEYARNTFETAAANPGYNVMKHDSDRIDNEQLYYLCDPTLFLLTDDEDIRNRCSGSGQCNQILLLREM